MTRFRPGDERELTQLVAWAAAEEQPLEVISGGTKRGLGRPLQTAHSVELGALSGIRSYEPAELVLTAGAATPLATIEAALAAEHQMLAFEPGDWGALWGGGTAGATGGGQTLGGIISCNLAGPRRIRQGAARDHLLGFSAVSGRGEAFKAGGKVVKNVTGYDLCKLMAGAYGTLAVMSEVTVKVLPRPETAVSVVLLGLDEEAGVRAMNRALNSPHEVGGAAHLPPGLAVAGGLDRAQAATALRLEGPAPSVASRSAALRAELAGLGPVEILASDASARLWCAIADVAPFAADGDRVIWRVSVPPAAGPALVAAVRRRLDAQAFLDWGGGLVWLAICDGGPDGGAAILRGALPAGGGHATLVRAPDPLRAAVPVFEPQPPGLAALTARVKDGFDPRRILNPGRLYRGL